MIDLIGNWKNFVKFFVRILSNIFVRILTKTCQNFDRKLSEFRQITDKIWTKNRKIFLENETEFGHMVLKYLTVTFPPSATNKLS
jgi:hypothetical protein